MLEINGIKKRFGDVTALNDVSLTVRRGHLVGFLGPNGSGKTTTMRAVMGLIAIDAGSITWAGEAIGDATRRRFGYMPAERGMYPKMTVREQLTYFSRLSGASAADAAVAAARWMDRVDIAGRADDEVQALSSGNQQRVQLAIALVHDPELLILDEPFSGLDPVAVENMKQILDDQLRAGTSVLFSSHQLDLVTDISREVVIVDGGSVVLSGDVRTIRERADFRYATIRFSSTTEWTPTVGVLVAPGGATTERIDDAVRVEVRADVSPAAVLADAERAGTVVEFAFAPPDLSEVFFTAVGRRPHEEGRRPHDEGRRPHEESVVER